MATDATILAVGVEAKGVQQATTDLRNLSEQAKKTEASTKSLGSSLGQQQSALAKTEQENNKLIESWAREVTMLGKTKSEMMALEGQHRGFNSAQMESVKVLQSKIKAFEDSSKAAQDHAAAQEASTARVAKGLAMLGTAATVAIGALAALYAMSVKSATEAEQASLRLEAVLKATGGSAGVNKKQIDDLADSMARLTQFDDESLRNAAGSLLSFGNVGATSFERTMKAGADLAAFMGTDLNNAVRMLGKALEDPEQGMTALRRAGVMLSEEQITLAKAAAEAGDKLEAQRIILDALEGKIGGVAEKMNSGLAKATSDAAKAFGELTESIGKTDAVGGTFTATMTALAGTLTYVKGLVDNGRWFVSPFSSANDLKNLAQPQSDESPAETARMAAAQNETAKAAERAANATAMLRVEREKAGAGLAKLLSQYSSEKDKLADNERQLSSFASRLGYTNAQIEQMVKQMREAATAAGNKSAATKGASESAKLYGDEMRRLNDEASKELKASAEQSKWVEKVEAGLDRLYAAEAKNVEALDKGTAAYQKQIDALTKTEDAVLREAAAQLESNIAQIEAIGGRDDNTEAMQRQLDVLNKLINVRDNKEAADTAAKTAKEAEDAWKRTADSIENSLTDALMRGFESGKDWAKNFGETLKNMFGSLVLRPVIQAVLAPVAGGAVSMFSGGASASSGGGLGGIGGIGNLGGSFLSGIGDSIFGGGGGAAFGAGFSAPWSTLSSIVGGAGEFAAPGMALASGLGAAIPVIGTALAIGSMIYSFVKANKDPAQVKGQFQVGGTNFEDSAFVKSRFGDLGFADAGTQQFSGEAAKSFSKIVADLLDAAADQMSAGQIARVAEKLNATIFEGLEGTFTTQDFLSKYGADILQQTMSVAFDELNPRLAELMRAFEGSAEEMGGYAEKLIQVQAFVGQAADAYGGIYANLSADDVLALSDAFGGLGNVMSATESYMAALYSDTERLALTSDALQRQFEKLGVAMPESKDAFRSLVEGLDLTTEQGRLLYTELLRVAPAFVAVSDAATESAAAMQRAAEALRGDMAAFDAMQTSRPADKATISRNALIDQYLAGDAARGTDFQEAYGGDYGAYASAVGGMQREEFGKFEDADRDAILQIIKAQQELTAAYTKAAGVIDSVVGPTRDFYSAVDDGTTTVAKAQDWSNEIAQKSIELLQAQGKEIEALNAQRAIELASLKDAPAELLTLVNTLYDLRVESVNAADAARAVAEAEKAAADAAEEAAKAKQRLVDATEDEIAAYKETIDAFLVPLGDLDAAMREIEPTANALVDAWASNKRKMTELADALAELDGTRAKTRLEALGETMAAIERIGNARTNIADNLLDLMAGKVDPASVKVLKDREAALAETLQTAPDKAEIAAKLTQITLRRIQLEGAIEQNALDERWKLEQKVLQEQIDLTKEARDVEVELLRERISGAERLRDIAAGMGKYLSSLRAGPLSPLGYTERLGEAKGLFEKTIGDALAGNIDAFGELQGRAQNYLGQAQAYFGGATGGYADVFKVVTDALEKFGLDAATASNIDTLQAQLEALESIQFVLEESAADQVDTTDAQIAALQALDVSFAGIEDGLRESAQDQTAALREQLTELRTVVANQEAQIKQAAAAYTAMLTELKGMNTKLDGIKADGALAEAAA